MRVSLALVCAALVGCGNPAPVSTSSHAAVLKAADAHDGAEDHVVHECPGCMLGMKGSEEHAVEVEGYTLHFCSSTCKSGFEGDVEAGLADLGKAVAK